MTKGRPLPPVVRSTIPNINDLYDNKELTTKANDLNILLNQEPKKEWIKEHNNFKYIPIEIVEYLLTSIYIKWRVDIKWSKVVANSIEVAIRLNVKDPITSEWDYQDGIGYAPIQTDKGAGATDFSKVKHDGAMKAGPSAESFAIKDAAEKFGKLFGKDLNRKDAMTYANLSGRFQHNDLRQQIVDALHHYEGEDKEEIRQMCEEKARSGEFTDEFALNIANKMGIKL